MKFNSIQKSALSFIIIFTFFFSFHFYEIMYILNDLEKLSYYVPINVFYIDIIDSFRFYILFLLFLFLLLLFQLSYIVSEVFNFDDIFFLPNSLIGALISIIFLELLFRCFFIDLFMIQKKILLLF